MLIRIILNKCHKFKSFLYGNARFAENEGRTVIEIEVKPKVKKVRVVKPKRLLIVENDETA